MACRLGQHLVRAKSKAENFGLFALCPCYFFICCLVAPWSNFWLLLRKESQPPNANHCNQAISFWARAEWEGLNITECPVGFDHNAIIPQIVQNTLPRLKPSFSKMWKCPQYSKQLLFDTVVAFRIEKYLIGCKIQDSRIQLFADKLIT